MNELERHVVETATRWVASSKDVCNIERECSDDKSGDAKVACALLSNLLVAKAHRCMIDLQLIKAVEAMEACGE
jgi:hypothetical protein